VIKILVVADHCELSVECEKHGTAVDLLVRQK